MARICQAGLVAFAVVVCAWFALGVRQARDTSRASALIGGPAPLTAQQAQRARSLLSAAGALNPDLGVEILRGQLASERHQNARAEQILASVTQREPLNLQAWSQLLYAAARAGDRRTLVRAARNLSALYPKLK